MKHEMKMPPYIQIGDQIEEITRQITKRKSSFSHSRSASDSLMRMNPENTVYGWSPGCGTTDRMNRCDELDRRFVCNCCQRKKSNVIIRCYSCHERNDGGRNVGQRESSHEDFTETDSRRGNDLSKRSLKPKTPGGRHNFYSSISKAALASDEEDPKSQPTPGPSTTPEASTSKEKSPTPNKPVTSPVTSPVNHQPMIRNKRNICQSGGTSAKRQKLTSVESPAKKRRRRSNCQLGVNLCSKCLATRKQKNYRKPRATVQRQGYKKPLKKDASGLLCVIREIVKRLPERWREAAPNEKKPKGRQLHQKKQNRKNYQPRNTGKNRSTINRTKQRNKRYVKPKERSSKKPVVVDKNYVLTQEVRDSIANVLKTLDH